MEGEEGGEGKQTSRPRATATHLAGRLELLDQTVDVPGLRKPFAAESSESQCHKQTDETCTEFLFHGINQSSDVGRFARVFDLDLLSALPASFWTAQ